MNGIKYNFLKLLCLVLIYMGNRSLLAFFISFFIKEFISNKRDLFIKESSLSNNVTTVLILDINRFRGDVELLSKDNNIRFLTISWSILGCLLACFVKEPGKKEKENDDLSSGFRSTFRMSPKGSEIYVGREKYRKFLYQFLPILFKRLGVDLVMNSDHRYRREADICQTSSELGYHHICYYREALYTTPGNYHLAVLRHKEYGKFYGNMIAVQNKITKQMFVESNMTSPDKITIRGCPRMDDYINLIKKKNKFNTNIIKQISFFSCPRGAQTMDVKTIDFFENSKQIIYEIGKYCKINNNLKFIIKMKDMHMSQLPTFKKIISEIFSDKIPNNIIFETGRMAAQKIILSSDIVISMQSTIALEASISGIPVILPHVRMIREVEGADQVLMYQEHRDLFDVPEDYSDLLNIIKYRLKNPTIEKSVMKKRLDLFEEQISPLNDNATHKSLELIKNLKNIKL